MGPTRDNQLFSMLLLGLTLSLSLGCTSKPDEVIVSQAQVPATQKVIVKKAKVAAVRPDDKQLKDWSIQLKKSHEIFREVWAHIWEDRLQNPMSVFSEIERLLQNHKNHDLGTYETRRTQCPDKASEIEFIRRADGRIDGAVFYRLSCRGAELLPGKIEIARVQKNNGREQWSFINEYMPRAAGQSMAFLRETTRCTSSLDERARLTAMECQNLGQNRDSEMHLNFSEFKYQKNAKSVLQVEGKKFRLLTTPVCDNPKFCTMLNVPLAGAIEIFEDTRSEQVREERRLAMQKQEREEEAKAAIEQHKKNMAELQKKAATPFQPGQALVHAGLHSVAQGSGGVPGSGVVVPGQTITQEPQFAGGDVMPGSGGLMEFDHSAEAAQPAPQIIPTEEYNARMGQPLGDVAAPLPREAAPNPIER